MQGTKRVLAAVAAAVALVALLFADVRVWAAGTYSVSVSDAAVVEADFANFTVRLSERVQPGDQIRVDIALEPGTATVGTCPMNDVDDIDITFLTFTAGEQTKVVAVQTCDDSVVEDPETFELEITGASVDECSPEPNRCAAVVADPKGVGTITDDDTPGELSVGDVSKPEGDAGPSVFTHTIELSGPPPGPGQELKIRCETEDGSAKSDNVPDPDYDSAERFVVFTTGQRTATFDVTVRGDTDEESDETYTVRCSDAETTGGPAPTFADDEGEGEILNDDAGPTPPPTTEPREYDVEISDAAATEGGTANFRVSLNRPVQTGDTVTVNLSTEEGTATLTPGPCAPGDDAIDDVPPNIMFTGGQETRIIPIETCPDTHVEQTESFFVRIDSATCAPIAECSVAVTDFQGRGTITDDDASGQLTVGDVDASEGDIDFTPFSHTIRLTGGTLEPGQSFEVTCETEAGSATDGVDYESETAAVTFTSDDRSKQFVVDVIGDITPENDETYVVKCRDATSTGTPALAQSDLPTFEDDTGLGTIRNDDGVPPTPSPTPPGQTPSPTPSGQTPVPTPAGQTPSPSPTPSATPTPTPCPTASPTPTPTPTGQTPTPTPTPPTPTPSPTPTPCATASPTASPTSSVTPTPSGATTTCTVSDTTPARGDSVSVTCSGWQSSTSVTITFQSDPVLLATVTTTATGTLSASVTIPSSATAGSHSLVLVGTAANGTARTVTIPLTVTGQVSATTTPTNATSTAVPATTVPISTSNPATLPRTGLDIGRLFTIGFILVLLGWTGIQLTRSSDSQPLWSVATERFSSALNFGGHDNTPRPSRFARVLSTLRRRRS